MFEYCNFIPSNYSYFSSQYMEEFKKPFYSRAFHHIVNKREVLVNKSLDIILRKSKNLEEEEVVDASTGDILTVYDLIIPVIGTLIILANLAVVISSSFILKSDQQPRSTYLFLGNVAMADLLTGIAIIFGDLYPKGMRDHNTCAIQLGMIVSATMTSIYSVGLIAIDRYLYILYGLKYSYFIYPNRAKTLISSTWIIGLIIGFLPLLGWSGDTKDGEMCWFIILAPRNLILLTAFIGAIPIITVVVLYSIILHHALKKIIQLQECDARTNTQENRSSNCLRIFKGRKMSIATIHEDSDENDKINIKCWSPRPVLVSHGSPPSKWKAIKVVLLTTSSFVITWSPYFISSVIFATSCDFEDTRGSCQNLKMLIASPFAILGFSNSMINPVIYAWWHKGFRTFVKDKFRVLIQKVRRRNEWDSAENTSTQNTRQSSRSCDDTVCIRAESF